MHGCGRCGDEDKGELVEFNCLISPPAAGYWIFHQSDDINKHGVDIYDRLAKYKLFFPQLMIKRF